AAQLTGRAGRRGGVPESAMTIIKETFHPGPGDTDQQIQPSVAVHIREHRPAIITLIPLQPRLLGDVGEPTTAQVFVKRISAVQTAEIKIGLPVVVEVSDSDA